MKNNIIVHILKNNLGLFNENCAHATHLKFTLQWLSDFVNIVIR